MASLAPASFGAALAAAHDASGAQHYPQGTLYVVANRYDNGQVSDGIVLTERVEVPHAGHP